MIKTQKIIQANSWIYVKRFLKHRPLDYIVSIPINTTIKEWNGCKSNSSLCMQRNECQCKYIINSNHCCIPVISNNILDKINIANQDCQKILINNILIDYSRGIYKPQFFKAVVLKEDYSLLSP